MNREAELEEVEAYRNLDLTQDYEKQAEEMKKFKAKIDYYIEHNEIPMDYMWWDDKIDFLLDVCNEKGNDDSENEFGLPIYKEEKDEVFQNLKVQYAEFMEKHEAKKAARKQENKERKQQGLPLLPAITDEELEDDHLYQFITARMWGRKYAFAGELEAKRQLIFGVNRDPSDQSEKPSIINQLNIALHNVGLQTYSTTYLYTSDFDRRCEVAIVALQERRRFNQCRKLGFDIPLSYVRIRSILRFPKILQQELIKYPHAITDDPDYLPDEEVLKQYKGNFEVSLTKFLDDPLEYICGYSQHKREVIEASRDAPRIWAARIKAGDYKYRYQDMVGEIRYQAIHQALEAHGLMRGLTKEKLNGTHQRPAILNDEAYCNSLIPIWLAKVLKQFYDEYPDMFQRCPDIREELYDELLPNPAELKKYPEVINAMFWDMTTPEPFRIEETQNEQNEVAQNHPQILLDQPSENKELKEKSYSPSPSAFDDNYVDPTNLQQIQQRKELLEKLNQLEKERMANQNKSSEKQSKVKEEENKSKKGAEKSLKSAFDDASSESSGKTREYYDTLYGQEKIQLQQEFKQKALQLKAEKERYFAFPFYNLLITKANLAGVKELKKQINDSEMRKLSRKEQTHYLNHHKLPPSAEESDDTLKNSVYTNEVLIAKQKKAAQKTIKMKKFQKQYKDHDVLNLEGMDIKIRDLKDIIYRDVQAANKRGNDFVEFEWVKNLGDPKKEKIMRWNTETGFDSEVTDDERTAYDRAVRQYLRKRQEKHHRIYLRERPIKNFELTMLKLGGDKICKHLFGKNIDVDNITTVYQWVDPEVLENVKYPGISDCRSANEFNAIYNKERETQEKVMRPEQVEKNLFANELIDIYNFFKKGIQSRDIEYSDEMQRALPKTERFYVENINMQEFRTPPESPKAASIKASKQTPKSSKVKSYGDFEQSVDQIADGLDHLNLGHSQSVDLGSDKNRLSLKESPNPNNELKGEDQQDQFSQHYSDVNNNFEQQSIAQESSIEYINTYANQEDKLANEQPIVEQTAPQRIIKESQVKFNFPPVQVELTQRFKKHIDFHGAKLVDDREETYHIIEEQKFINPDDIENILIPQLDKLVKESNGALEGYYIYPHHRKGGMDLIYPQGRRYPKRLRLNTYRPEDKVIRINGVDVGYLKSNVPFLNPHCWEKQAIPLSLQTGRRESLAPWENQMKQAQKTQLATIKEEPKVNPKKRKFDEAMNMGVGMHDYHKGDQLLNLERHLPFLRYSSDEISQLPIELNSINKVDEKDFKIAFALKPKMQIAVDKKATQKKLTIINKNKLHNQLKLILKDFSTQKKSEKFIETNAEVPFGSLWILKNEGSRPINVEIIIKNVG